MPLLSMLYFVFEGLAGYEFLDLSGERLWTG